MAPNSTTRGAATQAQPVTDTHGADDDENRHDYEFAIPSPVDQPELPLAMDWLDTRLVKVWSVKTSRYTGEKTRKNVRWVQIHEDYELTTRCVHSSQQDVANAWRDMQFPQHSVGRRGRAEITNSANFRGYQNPDGSGLLQHYSTTEAIRTRHGVVIDNADCWSAGFAHCTLPDDKHFGPGGRELDECDGSGHFYSSEKGGWVRNCNGPHWYDVEDKPGYYAEPGTDWRFPVGAIRDALRTSDAQTDEYGIVSVEETETHEGVPVVLAPLETGHMLVVFEDTTARRANDTECMVVLSPEEARSVRRPEDALDCLMPDEVAAEMARGLPVVGSDASNDDPRIPGDVIVRQGEWFAIPMDADYEPDRELSEAWQDDHLDSHRVRDFGISTQIRRDGAVWADDGHAVFGKGYMTHTRSEHERAYLGERWHRLVEDDHEVLIVEDHRNNSRQRTRTGWD